MAILEALKEILTLDKLLCSREFFVALTHDEEVSGTLGAIKVAARLKEILNGKSLDFIFDEGSFLIEDFQDKFPPVAMIGICEKGYLDMRLTAKIAGGHSSYPAKSTAITEICNAILKLNKVKFPKYLKDTPLAETLFALAPYYPPPMRDLINAMNTTEPQLKKLLSQDVMTLSQMHTTKVCTLFQGGNAPNVIPPECSANVNCRLHPCDTADSIAAATQKLVGPNIEVEVREKCDPPRSSRTDTDAYKKIVAAIRKTFPSTKV